MTVAGFDWDEGNIEKCQKHGVSLEEIESVFSNRPLTYLNERHNTDEIRYSAVDIRRTGNGILVVFTCRQGHEEMLIRPISARYMHQKEKQYYERQKET